MNQFLMVLILSSPCLSSAKSISDGSWRFPYRSFLRDSRVDFLMLSCRLVTSRLELSRTHLLTSIIKYSIIRYLSIGITFVSQLQYQLKLKNISIVLWLNLYTIIPSGSVIPLHVFFHGHHHAFWQDTVRLSTQL